MVGLVLLMTMLALGTASTISPRASDMDMPMDEYSFNQSLAGSTNLLARNIPDPYERNLQGWVLRISDYREPYYHWPSVFRTLTICMAKFASRVSLPPSSHVHSSKYLAK